MRHDWRLIAEGEAILNLKFLLFSLSLHPESSEISPKAVFFFFSFMSVSSYLSLHFHSFVVDVRHFIVKSYWSASPKSSCQEKTARTAPSTAFPATGVSTQTRPHTHRWQPLSTRARLPRPHLSLCQVCHRRTPLQTELSRENRTPLRSGPSPGACMKVGVSIFFLVAVGWGLHGAAGSMETLAVFKRYCTCWIVVWDKN